VLIWYILVYLCIFPVLVCLDQDKSGNPARHLKDIFHDVAKVRRRFFITFVVGTCVHQGCQIFLGTKYPNGGKYTKWPQNIPNGHKIFPMAAKIDQTIIKYSKIFHYKTLQNLPKLGFLVWKTNHLATLVYIVWWMLSSINMRHLFQKCNPIDNTDKRKT
jgi:hypothetical protein